MSDRNEAVDPAYTAWMDKVRAGILSASGTRWDDGDALPAFPYRAAFDEGYPWAAVALAVLRAHAAAPAATVGLALATAIAAAHSAYLDTRTGNVALEPRRPGLLFARYLVQTGRLNEGI